MGIYKFVLTSTSQDNFEPIHINIEIVEDELMTKEDIEDLGLMLEDYFDDYIAEYIGD